MVNLLIWLVVLAVVAYVAYYVITTFLPEPVKTPALAIVGLILLILLIQHFFGGGSELRLP